MSWSKFTWTWHSLAEGPSGCPYCVDFLRKNSKLVNGREEVAR